MTHPLFQALIPHTTYTLALDNAVLEGAWTVVNDMVNETWFDPLTATGYNVKQLFGAGYSGYKGLAAYPAHDYMTPWMDTDILYGRCLREYRAELANYMVFSVVTMAPNLIETDYAFTDPTLQAGSAGFHADLKSVDVSVRAMMPEFMRLEPGTDPKDPYPYNLTISASIQF